MRLSSTIRSRFRAAAFTPRIGGPGTSATTIDTDDFQRLDVNIARGRIVLSLLAMLSLYIDPTTAGGPFFLSAGARTIVLCHLIYSVTIFLALRRPPQGPRLLMLSTGLDLFFATAVAFFTEGQTSPSYVFFVFAIIAVGIRPGMLTTVAVTSCGVALYLFVIVVSERISNVFVMRAAYLAIAGYLIGFVGRQRAIFETRLRELETRAARHSIARSLHDGYVQALAGVNMRLHSCRELIRRGQSDDALTELTDLQTGVAREYDEVRAYIRELAGVEDSPTAEFVGPLAAPRFELQMNFAGHTTTGEHLLQILLEGLRNACRHGMPQRVTIDVRGEGDKLLITIDDDGVGFEDPANPPWAIASRVAELGGHLTVNHRGSTRLEIEMPNV